MELTLKLTGIGPMLQHNGRLANPLDPLTRELQAIAKKRNKTDEDLAAMALVEARAGLYETVDGLVGLPNENVWRCIYDAAKAFKLGEDIKRALIAPVDTPPVTINGEHVKAETYLEDPAHMLYRSVKVQRNRVMRARPMLTGWQSEHTFELLTDVIDVGNLAPVLERAGRLVGVGDWRPLYGKFGVDVVI